MTERVFESEMPVTRQELGDWHMRPGAFERLSPPWDEIELESQDRPIANGSRAVVVLKKGPFRKRWVARHEEVDPGRSFLDVQESGPFASWRHLHRFEDARSYEKRSLLIDELSFRLPFSPLSTLLAGAWASKEVDRLFRHRHEVTRRDLERHSLYNSHPLRIAISGGTGLVGTALSSYLATAGHEIHLLERRGGSSGPAWAGRIEWSVRDGTIEGAKLEGMDAVVHLAGAPIAVRWTEEAKRAILESRVRGTALLAETLASLERPPQVFVSASAIGLYGSRVDDRGRVETDPVGSGFLASVVAQWEAAAEPARLRGIRTVHPRLGVVLSAKGGALAKMLPAFRFGAGGPIGSGRQWFPWVSLDDVLGAIEHLIHREDLRGPFNLTAPQQVRQAEFARVLGRVLHRPSVAPLPAFAVRWIFGEMGEEALLGGVPVEPAALIQSGFVHQNSELEEALRAELGR